MATGITLDSRNRETFGRPARRADGSKKDREHGSRVLRIVDIAVLGMVGVFLVIVTALGGVRPDPTGVARMHGLGPVAPAAQVQRGHVRSTLQAGRQAALPSPLLAR